jgi:hypothetical protein
MNEITQHTNNLGHVTQTCIKQSNPMMLLLSSSIHDLKRGKFFHIFSFIFYSFLSFSYFKLK